MDNKENTPIDKFIKALINPYDSVQWKGGILPQDEPKVGTEAKSNQFFTDIPDSPNLIPYLSSNINFLQKKLEKLDTKTDKSNDKITSEFRWLVGLLFILIPSPSRLDFLY